MLWAHITRMWCRVQNSEASDHTHRELGMTTGFSVTHIHCIDSPTYSAGKIPVMGFTLIFTASEVSLFDTPG
jgi:hypothetical protein